MKKNFGFFILFTLFFASCEVVPGTDAEELEQTEEAAVLGQFLTIPDQADNYADPDLPAFFTLDPNTDQDNTPNNNPITDWGATLGRVLFYDVNLSVNNTISCASCHVQEFGFSDPATLSEGFDGGLTGRNSMGLSNSRYYENGHFFWNERAESLEEQVLIPIQDEVEMGLTLNELETRVQTQPYYPTLFEQAYGDEEITSDRIALALSQFVRSIVSYQSKYDEGRDQVNQPTDDFPNFSDLENLGKRVFFSNQTNCSNCHTSDFFVGDEARNNGLDEVITDLGLGGFTGRNQDSGMFKTSSLRNIELTAPYMHDGRFEPLEEVVEHYNSGVQDNPTLDNRLQRNGRPVRMNLSDQEKAALVAFMKTLTDYELIADVKYSNLFVDQ